MEDLLILLYWILCVLQTAEAKGVLSTDAILSFKYHSMPTCTEEICKSDQIGHTWKFFSLSHQVLCKVAIDAPVLHREIPTPELCAAELEWICARTFQFRTDGSALLGIRISCLGSFRRWQIRRTRMR